MAKRQSKTAKTPVSSSNELPGKVRFEVRFDEDVYQGIKKVADAAQISVNQLMHALARWAGQQCKAGEPKINEDGVWLGETKPQPGTVTLGVPGEYREMTHGEIAHGANVTQMSHDEFIERFGAKTVAWKGKTWVFDFTERRVIREDL